MFGGTVRRFDMCHPASRQRKRCAEIEKEHSVRAWRHFGGDFGQVQIHCLDVALGKNEGGALALFGADRAEDVCRCRPLIVRRRRPCAAFCPTTRDFILLADARLVGEPNLYCPCIDILFARDLVQASWELFLNSSIAPSACTW